MFFGKATLRAVARSGAAGENFATERPNYRFSLAKMNWRHRLLFAAKDGGYSYLVC